jgi:hypothetical protein
VRKAQRDPPDIVGINHADHRLASLGSPK